MRFKPRNPNTEHEPLHQLLLAATGGGKSQLLKSGLVVPLSKDTRVVGYDDVGSLPGLYYTSRRGFLTALRKAVSRGGGYRVFYGGDQSTADYCWWCEVVWSILDGDHITYAVSEELSGPSPSSGEAPEPMALLLTQGRKYGLRHVGTTQRPPQISKTFYTQSRVKWVGQQDPYDVRSMARLAGVTEQQIKELQVEDKAWGQFYRSDGRASGGELVTVKFGPKKGVRWVD
jgi:hypothetical protein